MRHTTLSLITGLISTVITALTGASPAAPVYQEAVTPAPPAGESLALITAPGPGEVLTGQVTIRGTAATPDFGFYQLTYTSDPALSAAIWEPVQGVVAQQVLDDVLGVWDTTAVEDGRYILRLTVEAEGDVQLIHEVRVTIRNATPTPLPTPRPTTGLDALTTPTPGPSPTPLIQQPPTRTPYPALAGARTPTPEPAPAVESPLSPNRLSRAVRNGVIGAAAVFALMGLYAFVRAAARGTLQAGWRRFRTELLRPLVNGLRRKPKDK